MGFLGKKYRKEQTQIPENRKCYSDEALLRYVLSTHLNFTPFYVWSQSAEANRVCKGNLLRPILLHIKNKTPYRLFEVRYGDNWYKRLCNNVSEKLELDCRVDVVVRGGDGEEKSIEGLKYLGLQSLSEKTILRYVERKGEKLYALPGKSQDGLCLFDARDGESHQGVPSERLRWSSELFARLLIYSLCQNLSKNMIVMKKLALLSRGDSSHRHPDFVPMDMALRVLISKSLTDDQIYKSLEEVAKDQGNPFPTKVDSFVVQKSHELYLWLKGIHSLSELQEHIHTFVLKKIPHYLNAKESKSLGKVRITTIKSVDADTLYDTDNEEKRRELEERHRLHKAFLSAGFKEYLNNFHKVVHKSIKEDRLNLLGMKRVQRKGLELVKDENPSSNTLAFRNGIVMLPMSYEVPVDYSSDEYVTDDEESEESGEEEEEEQEEKKEKISVAASKKKEPNTPSPSPLTPRTLTKTLLLIGGEIGKEKKKEEEVEEEKKKNKKEKKEKKEKKKKEKKIKKEEEMKKQKTTDFLIDPFVEISMGDNKQDAFGTDTVEKCLGIKGSTTLEMIFESRAVLNTALGKVKAMSLFENQLTNGESLEKFLTKLVKDYETRNFVRLSKSECFTPSELSMKNFIRLIESQHQRWSSKVEENEVYVVLLAPSEATVEELVAIQADGVFTRSYEEFLRSRLRVASVKKIKTKDEGAFSMGNSEVDIVSAIQNCPVLKGKLVREITLETTLGEKNEQRTVLGSLSAKALEISFSGKESSLDKFIGISKVSEIEVMGSLFLCPVKDFEARGFDTDKKNDDDAPERPWSEIPIENAPSGEDFIGAKELGVKKNRVKELRNKANELKNTLRDKVARGKEVIVKKGRTRSKSPTVKNNRSAPVLRFSDAHVPSDSEIVRALAGGEETIMKRALQDVMVEEIFEAKGGSQNVSVLIEAYLKNMLKAVESSQGFAPAKEINALFTGIKDFGKISMWDFFVILSKGHVLPPRSMNLGYKLDSLRVIVFFLPRFSDKDTTEKNLFADLMKSSSETAHDYMVAYLRRSIRICKVEGVIEYARSQGEYGAYQNSVSHNDAELSVKGTGGSAIRWVFYRDMTVDLSDRTRVPLPYILASPNPRAEKEYKAFLTRAHHVDQKINDIIDKGLLFGGFRDQHWVREEGFLLRIPCYVNEVMTVDKVKLEREGKTTKEVHRSKKKLPNRPKSIRAKFGEGQSDEETDGEEKLLESDDEDGERTSDSEGSVTSDVESSENEKKSTLVGETKKLEDKLTDYFKNVDAVFREFEASEKALTNDKSTEVLTGSNASLPSGNLDDKIGARRWSTGPTKTELASNGRNLSESLKRYFVDHRTKGMMKVLKRVSVKDYFDALDQKTFTRDYKILVTDPENTTLWDLLLEFGTMNVLNALREGKGKEEVNREITLIMPQSDTTGLKNYLEKYKHQGFMKALARNNFLFFHTTKEISNPVVAKEITSIVTSIMASDGRGKDLYFHDQPLGIVVYLSSGLVSASASCESWQSVDKGLKPLPEPQLIRKKKKNPSPSTVSFATTDNKHVTESASKIATDNAIATAPSVPGSGISEEATTIPVNAPVQQQTPTSLDWSTKYDKTKSLFAQLLALFQDHKLALKALKDFNLQKKLDDLASKGSRLSLFLPSDKAMEEYNRRVAETKGKGVKGPVNNEHLELVLYYVGSDPSHLIQNESCSGHTKSSEFKQSYCDSEPYELLVDTIARSVAPIVLSAGVLGVFLLEYVPDPFYNWKELEGVVDRQSQRYGSDKKYWFDRTKEMLSLFDVHRKSVHNNSNVFHHTHNLHKTHVKRGKKHFTKKPKKNYVKRDKKNKSIHSQLIGANRDKDMKTDSDDDEESGDDAQLMSPASDSGEDGQETVEYLTGASLIGKRRKHRPTSKETVINSCWKEALETSLLSYNNKSRREQNLDNFAWLEETLKSNDRRKFLRLLDVTGVKADICSRTDSRSKRIVLAPSDEALEAIYKGILTTTSLCDQIIRRDGPYCISTLDDAISMLKNSYQNALKTSGLLTLCRAIASCHFIQEDDYERYKKGEIKLPFFVNQSELINDSQSSVSRGVTLTRSKTVSPASIGLECHIIKGGVLPHLYLPNLLAHWNKRQKLYKKSINKGSSYALSFSGKRKSSSSSTSPVKSSVGGFSSSICEEKLAVGLEPSKEERAIEAVAQKLKQDNASQLLVVSSPDDSLSFVKRDEKLIRYKEIFLGCAQKAQNEITKRFPNPKMISKKEVGCDAFLGFLKETGVLSESFKGTIFAPSDLVFLKYAQSCDKGVDQLGLKWFISLIETFICTTRYTRPGQYISVASRVFNFKDERSFVGANYKKIAIYKLDNRNTFFKDAVIVAHGGYHIDFPNGP